MSRQSPERLVVAILGGLIACSPAFPQGTMHRPRPETETTDSSGHLKNGAASDEGATIRGSVILSDGSSPRQLVSLYCDCAGVQTLVAMADAKGAFSFNRGALDVISQGKACSLRPFLEGYKSENRPIGGPNSKHSKTYEKLRLEPLSSNPAGLTSLADEQASKAQRRTLEKALDEAAKGQLASAISVLQKATAEYPQYSSAWFTLGILQQNRGDKRGAEASFQEALRADPKFALPLIRLATLESEKGDWRNSVDHSAKAIEINPAAFPDAYALNAMGNVNRQNVEAAEKSAREGLKLDADHQYPELQFALGIVLYAKGDNENAAKFLRSYLSHAPNGPNSETARNQLSQIEQSGSALSARNAAQESAMAVGGAAQDSSGPAFTSMRKENAPLLVNTPTHTCLESIERVQIDTRGKLHDPDLARVQIAVSEGKEIYGYVDGKRFSNERLAEMLGYTFSTTGLFSSIARELISGTGDRIAFAGKEDLNGEPVLRYRFRFLPSEFPWAIDFGKESGVAGEEGSFFLDSSKLILRRVVLRAAGIPNNLKLKDLDVAIDYNIETVAGRRVLLPYVARVHVTEGSGIQRVSRMFFNHCRSFTTEATLSFATADQELTRNGPEASPDLPPDLNIVLALQSPITAAGASENDVLTATVAQPVYWKKREIVAAGAAVEGHVLPLHGQIIVEFDRIQMKSGWAPFYARLVSVSGSSQITAEILEARKVPDAGPLDPRSSIVAADPEIPGVAKIDLPHGPVAELPAGTKMAWKTESLGMPIQMRQPELSTPISIH